MSILWIIVAVAVLFLVWVIAVYNRFIRLVQRSKEAWADIDVQLKRRYDLIPNLVEAVKGYVKHEAGTLEKVTAARAAAMDAGGVEEKGKAENMLTGALKSLFAVAESYPDLKANTNFLELQRELNTAVESFPGNVIANSFRFEQREFFALEESDSAARNPVAVKF